jgi:hypothetical protein
MSVRYRFETIHIYGLLYDGCFVGLWEGGDFGVKLDIE